MSEEHARSENATRHPDEERYEVKGLLNNLVNLKEDGEYRFILVEEINWSHS